MSKQKTEKQTPLDAASLDDSYFYQKLSETFYSDAASRLATDKDAGKLVYSSGMLNDDDCYDSKLGDFSSSASGINDEHSAPIAERDFDDDYFDQHIDEKYPYQSYDDDKASQELVAYKQSVDITQARIEAEQLIKEAALQLKKQAERSYTSCKLLPDGHKEKISITQESSSEYLENARILMAKMIYQPEEIYDDAYFFNAVEITKEPYIEEVLAFDMDFHGGRSLLVRARSCPKIDSIAPACISYLQEHFPFANKYDQEQFNLIILALFEKVKEGDICIDLRSLNGVFDAIVNWQLTYNELQNFSDTQGVLNSLEFLIASAKAYCPKSVATLNELMKKSLSVGSADEKNSPLVYDNGRLYLRRSFNYETGIADFICNKKNSLMSDEDKQKLIKAIRILFPKEPSDGELEVNMQEVAAALSAQSKFTVISGGPGTGKTTTVLRILLLLICMDEKNRNIKLCAPTGKAAARMSESIAGQLSNSNTQAAVELMAKEFGLSIEQIMGYIPSTAVTVHSLIKTIPNSSRARFNKDNRLKCDVLVVDEVSMLDMALFSKLLSALEDDCHIIMLGDKDQLASVEAGAVLAELCACLDSTKSDRVDDNVMSIITEATGYTKKAILKEKISGNVALLSKSWRSKDVPEIGALASLINNAKQTELENSEQLQIGLIDEYMKSAVEKIERAEPASNLDKSNKRSSSTDDPVLKRMFAILGTFNKAQEKAQKNGTKAAISYTKFNKEKTPADFVKEIASDCIAPDRDDNYSAFLQELARNDFIVSTDTHKRAHLFKLMDRFRILCSNHNGEFGDKNLNHAIEKEIKHKYLTRGFYPQGSFFPGQIVIITQNNPILNLVNGYVGFVAFDEQDLLKQSLDKGEDFDIRRIPYKERKLRVFLPIASGGQNGQEVNPFTVISTMLLTEYDSGYAMSIHKSQGSEYDKVSIVLSRRPNRVLTKELVYTGITRAKKNVELISSFNSLRHAISHSVERESGLADRLNR